MAKELIAFLNFEFRQKSVNIKSVSGESMTEVPRFVINWPDYQAVLAARGLKHAVQDRPLFRRYLSYHSGEDMYNDLVAFQEEMRRTLTAVITSKTVPEAFWKRVFKDTDGLPMFIKPEGEGDWALESAADFSFHYDFSADTYRLFVLAMVRELILNRRLFSLTVDEDGVFELPEAVFEAAQDQSLPLFAAAEVSEVERRAALQTTVARALPAALTKAVAEKLPMALAESAAEKLPLVMAPLVEAQLPEALSRAVEERVEVALAAAVAEKLPSALNMAVEEKLPEALEAAVREQLPAALAKAAETEPAPPLTEELLEEFASLPDKTRLATPEPGGLEGGGAPVSITGPSVGPSFSISVPSLRLVATDSSISIPAPLRPPVKMEEEDIFPAEPEEEYILPREIEAEEETELLPMDEGSAPALAPEPAEDFVFLSEVAESIENIEPEPLTMPLVDPGAMDEPLSFSMIDPGAAAPVGEVPDIDPVEYASTFQEEAVEEGLAMFDVGGPAREDEKSLAAPDFDHTEDDAYLYLPAQPGMAGFAEAPRDPAAEPEEEYIEPEGVDFEAIEPAETIIPLDVSANEKPDETIIPLEVRADETVIPLNVPAEEIAGDAVVPPDVPGDEQKENDGEGWLPFLKVPSKKKGGKVPLEQRLATLEQRRKRRRDPEGQDTFDF